MPIWQYTAAALNQGDNSIPYYPNETPLSPSYTNPSSVPSALNSPIVAGFPHDARLVPQPLTPLYDGSNKSLNVHLPRSPQHGLKDEEMEEEEDSDTYSWEPKSTVPKQTGPPHRRTQSANEVSARNAKRAHTVVVRYLDPTFALFSTSGTSHFPFTLKPLSTHPSNSPNSTHTKSNTSIRKRTTASA
jgi:hypothetical protein